MSKQSLIEQYGIKNVINYLRRSRQDVEREKKTGEDTLHEQKVLMDRVLADYGVPYDQEAEIGSGDKISTRPVFQKIIKDIEDEKYDAIAVKEISRMGRGSYTDMGIIYDLITEKNLYIITPWKIYDPQNPSDLRQIRFELFMSREEYETTRERLNGGRYNAALEGKWVSGAAPFGFNYNSDTKRLEINEEEAEVVRTIFDFYANGIVLKNGKRKLVQFRALASYLSRIGIKTPQGKNHWYANQVKDILEHDRYIGVLRQNTTKLTADGKKIPRPESEHIVVYDAHPAIIDMKTWNKAQDRINNRETTPKTKLDFSPCELAGIIVCKKCGRRLIRRAGTNKYRKKDGTVSTYYKEFLTCNTNGCTYVKYRAVEEDLLRVLRYIQDLDEKTLNKYLKSAIVNEEESRRSAEDIKKYIETRKEELKARMKFIYEKYESGIYTDEMFLERKEEVDKQLEELDKIETDKPSKPEEPEINRELVKENINTVLDAYKNATRAEDKNKILHSVFSHVILERTKKARGTKPSEYIIEPYLKSSFIKKRL